MVISSLRRYADRACGDKAGWRVGQGGQLFRLFKLRTMVPNADAVLEQALASNPAVRAEWDEFQKLRYDPRITRIGRILRKSSLDELPQLLNVALGSMSIVGPRPIMDNQRDIEQLRQLVQ